MDRVRSIATRRVVQPLLSWCANFASLPYYINGRKHRQKQEHKYNRSTPLTVGFVTHQTNGGGVFSQYFPAVGFLSKMLKELIQFSETFLQARTSWKSRTIELWRLANWQIARWKQLFGTDNCVVHCYHCVINHNQQICKKDWRKIVEMGNFVEIMWILRSPIGVVEVLFIWWSSKPYKQPQGPDVSYFNIYNADRIY